MKWIAIFIAIGSIIGGWVLYSWPVEPCSGGSLSAIGCLNGLFEIFMGLSTLISGIVLLLLVGLTNLHHRILSAIGAFVSFVLAIMFFGGTLFLIYSFEADLSQSGFVLFMIGNIEGIAFLCTGLSTNVIKNLIAGRRAHPELPRKTL